MQFQNKLLVLPTARAIREYVSSHTTDSLLPKLVTIGDFFQNFTYSDSRLCPDEIRQKFLADSISLANGAQLGISTNYSIFLNQSEYLFKFFEELSSEKIDINKLQTHDTYAMYDDHLNILKEILKNYLKLLDDNNYVDKISIVSKIKFNYSYFDRFDQVEIVLESYLTKFEYDCLYEIRKSTFILIKLKSTKYNMKNLEKFAWIGNFDKNFEYLLDFSSGKILDSKRLIYKDFEHQIIPVSNRFEQIDFINYAIFSMLNQNIDPKKICVVLPDESFSQTLLACDDDKKLNFAMGYSFINTYFYQKFDAFCEALIDDDPKTFQKIKYFGLDGDFFDNTLKNKDMQTSFDFIDKLHIFFENGISDETIQKIDYVFYYYQNLVRIGFQFSNIELIKSMKIKFSELCLDYIDGGEVTVLGILEVRNISFDGVIIVDFNDSKLPKSNVKDKFISTQVKKLSNLTTSLDRINLQKYYYDRLLSSAKSVFVSYVLSEQDSISTFAIDLFGKNKIENNMKFLKFNNFEIPKQQNNSINYSIKLDEIVWSAYKLKDFLICKKRFYFKYIAKLDEAQNDLYGASKKDIGVVIHKILQLTFSDSNYKKDLFGTIKKYFYTFKSTTSSMIFEQNVWLHRLEDFANFELQRIQQGAVIIDLESRFETNINGIAFVGVIDRIDKFGDVYHLIDYKTGKVGHKDENDFQLEIYSLAKKDLNAKAFIYDLKNTKYEEKFLSEENFKKLFDRLEGLKKTIEIFDPTDKIADCSFCPYKIICGIY